MKIWVLRGQCQCPSVWGGLAPGVAEQSLARSHPDTSMWHKHVEPGPLTALSQ